jgi:hypothetical protein
MLRPGSKPKVIAKPRWNPYSYRLPGPFLGSSEAFLCTAKGQDSEDEAVDDDVAVDDVRRRSWAREQKLDTVKYTASTYVSGKTGADELISHNAAVSNISCTPKMLHTWIQTYNKINTNLKGF